MNHLIIRKCDDCNDFCPIDSYGANHGCSFHSNEGRPLEWDKEHEEYPIPDWCPKIAEHNKKLEYAKAHCGSGTILYTY